MLKPSAPLGEENAPAVLGHQLDSVWVEVSYVVATGGSGVMRMALANLPAWIEGKPGVLVYKVYPLSTWLDRG